VLFRSFLSVFTVGNFNAQELSLDSIDRENFHAKGSPFDGPAQEMKVYKENTPTVVTPSDISLNGIWEMAEGGGEEVRLNGLDWHDAIPAIVPGSVHSALWKAGKIPDPYFGQNDSIAERQSYKTWWFRRKITIEDTLNAPELIFNGIANKCSVWINKKLLGSHEGMFGGPQYDIKRYLVKGDNHIVVKINPIPQEFTSLGDNSSWQQTVVFNNVYGWHYSQIPSLGIWRDVHIKNSTSVEIENPFFATQNMDGQMKLSVTLRKRSVSLKGKIVVAIRPENFKGEPEYFQYLVNSSAKTSHLNLRFKLTEPQLWWPNDMGKPNLYHAEIYFITDKGIASRVSTSFGIRTIEMKPFPEGPNPNLYNWTFVINGKPMFVKGTGWCTMDALMNFSRERYEHYLSIAKLQHIQMLRAWGSGMPETDDFYDLCDRYGIMVLQEWPTAWDSHKTQPYPLLENTVKTNTLRLRNHPALVMWGGGNESPNPTGPVIDMMGRYSIELDGTRPFHRGEPFGGSQHNYSCWWNNAHLNFNLSMISRFWGEFGIASMPHIETVLRYMPEDEKNQWPPQKNGSFLHHMPIFGKVGEYSKLKQYSGYIMPNDNMEYFITGSQLAQVIAVRHTLERARTMWPNTTGALYYKMNDNYPAASWSCVDFYGAIKPLHYFVQNSFSPVAVVILFEQTNLAHQQLDLPLFLLDDNGELNGFDWKVSFRCYNNLLDEQTHTELEGKGNGDKVVNLGVLNLTRNNTGYPILLFVAELHVQGVLQYRSFYFTNTEVRPGSLFNLSRTTCETIIDGNKVTVTNTGKKPAVGVNISSPGNADKFIASENFFWLEPGESKTVNVNITDSLVTDFWNKDNNKLVE
jgi:beta-mannosidase